MGMDLLEAKVFPSYTLGCTMIGYILGIILIPKYISQKNALIGCTLLGLALSFGVVWADFDMTLFGHQANASIFFLNALGFPNALIYAGIWPLSIHGLGKFTKTGSSLLIMGLCGNAILPWYMVTLPISTVCVSVTGYLFLVLSIWCSLPSKGIKSIPGDRIKRKTLKIKKWKD